MPLPRPNSRRTALCLSLGLLGCQPRDRVEECRAVVRLVNPTLAAIDADRNRAPRDAATYRSIAERYEAAASTLETMRSSNRRLLEAVIDYSKVLREGAHDARQFADALDARNGGREGVARAAAGRTAKHEAASAPRLESVCRGR